MKTTLPYAEWLISADQFPSDASSEEKLGFVLNYAILAPSVQNTQPWFFRIHGNVLDLYADGSRALAVADPNAREMFISCGAALFHIKLALQYFGVSHEVVLTPDAQNKTWLASVVLGLKCDTDGDVVPLFHSIPRRHTNRHPYLPEPVPEALIGMLQADAEFEGAQLHVAGSDDARHAVADLVAEGDRIQWSNRQFRREVASWLRPNAHPGQDGIPASVEGLRGLASEFAPLVIRTFDRGKGRAVKDRDLALGSPVLALLATDGDSPKDWLRSGQALARVLLRARSEDVWASFLNRPIEVTGLRSQLTECLGRIGWAQILMRLGYSDHVPPTPRRSVSTVLLRPEHGSIRISGHST